jgi:nicotinamidase-related amidase
VASVKQNTSDDRRSFAAQPGVRMVVRNVALKDLIAAAYGMADIPALFPDRVLGGPVVQPLLPDSEDYFVLKPMHSAFYMTPLEVLLRHLQVDKLILAGLTSNSCITATAHDANMRGFDIYIPPDCSCARNAKEHTQALAQLEAMVGANLIRSPFIKLPNLIRPSQSPRGA